MFHQFHILMSMNTPANLWACFFYACRTLHKTVAFVRCRSPPPKVYREYYRGERKERYFMEETAVLTILLENAIHSLSAEEQELIRELYYLDKTEQEVNSPRGGKNHRHSDRPVKHIFK